MLRLMSYLLVALATLLAVPVGVFFIEIMAAIMLAQREHLVGPSGDPRRRVMALVPAHNESLGLLRTLVDIKAQLRAGDGLLVVADNCTDDTAVIAKAAGAEV